MSLNFHIYLSSIICNISSIMFNMLYILRFNYCFQNNVPRELNVFQVFEEPRQITVKFTFIFLQLYNISSIILNLIYFINYSSRSNIPRELNVFQRTAINYSIIQITYNHVALIEIQ